MKTMKMKMKVQKVQKELKLQPKISVSEVPGAKESNIYQKTIKCQMMLMIFGNPINILAVFYYFLFIFNQKNKYIQVYI